MECRCPGAQRLVAGVCVLGDVCMPNPCQGDQTCQVVEDRALCGCAPGFPVVDGGCGAQIFDCAAQHDTVADDGYEPNECPSSATATTAAGAKHNLTAGDHDWLFVAADPLHVIRLNITGASVETTIDAYGTDGVSLLSGPSTGLKNQLYALTPPGANGVYFRARASDPTKTGEYTVVATDLGVDDFANVPAGALQLDGDFNGELQYPGDVDVTRLAPSSGGLAIQLARAASTDPSITIDVLDVGGQRVGSLTYNAPSFRVPTSLPGPVFLQAAGVAGRFSVSISRVMAPADDYGNSISAASTVTLGSAATPGAFEQAGDVDVLRFTATARHAYRASCSSVSASCRVTILTPSGAVLATAVSSPTTVVTAHAPSGVTELFVKLEPSVVSTTVSSYQWAIIDLGLASDDHSNSSVQATSIAVNSSQSGVIEYDDDLDVFSIELTQALRYTVTCSTTASEQCTFAVDDAQARRVVTGTPGETATASFTAASSGSHFITVRGGSTSSRAAYTLRITDVTAGDDHGDTVATATPLTLGSTMAGFITSTVADKDVFTFSGTAGQTYIVTCTTAASYLCNFVARDPSGNQLANISYGVSTTATISATSSGTFSIELSRYYSGYGGQYSLRVAEQGPDDHGNTAATATGISVGAPVGGVTQAGGDHDFFSFSATAKHIYRLNCTTTTSYLCTMTVRDSAATIVASSSYGTNVMLYFSAVAAATYNIDVAAYSSASTGNYTLTVTDMGLDDHGDTLSTASSITIDGPSVSGQIQTTSDIDMFSLTAGAGAMYTATCVSTVGQLCTLTVRDSSGLSIASASASGSSTTTASFTTANAGTFTVSVSGSVVGGYTLAVTTLVDDHGNTAGSATALVVGTATAVNIQFSGDKDVLAFTAAANTVFRVTCTTGTSYLCLLTVRNSAGNSVVTTSYGTSTTATFVTPVAGVYTIEVAASYSGYYGVCTLTLTQQGVDDHGNTADAGTAITVGNSNTGAIDYSGDIDTFVVNATTGTIYRFACTATAPYLCTLRAKDAAGLLLSSTSYGTSTAVSFKALTAGPYSVEVSASTTSGSYTVALSTVLDDFGDTPGAATGLALGVSRAGALDYADDADFFSASLTAGTSYTISVTSSVSPDLTVYNPSLGVVTTSGSSARTFTAAVTGTHYFKVSKFSATGAYSIVLTQ